MNETIPGPYKIFPVRAPCYVCTSPKEGRLFGVHLKPSYSWYLRNSVTIIKADPNTLQPGVCVCVCVRD